MESSQLMAISVLDGRYASKTQQLAEYFSEFALIKARLEVEIAWFKKLAELKEINLLTKLSADQLDQLQAFIDNFSITDAQQVKQLEQTTNHDVKAVEYYLKQRIKNLLPNDNQLEFVHFSCTSEDINNLAYGLMINNFKQQVLLPVITNIIDKLVALSHQYAEVAMLSRTHGQAATPTTVGKEFANFVARLRRQQKIIQQHQLLGKINGAVGNFNAHQVAYPQVDWPQVASEVISSLGLISNRYTTQIEPHDNLIELLDSVTRFNTILLDLCRDLWGYISVNYFSQKAVKNEVGSSTMPHKVNPINFENAEGNLGVANALFNHFGAKLPISRWQRDLSDSTVLRSVGSGFAYSLVAYQNILQGLNKITVNAEQLQTDLQNNWAVLAEAVQTVMRSYRITNAYEKLKEFSRGKQITQSMLVEFINQQDLPVEVKQQLIALRPNNYLGLAAELAKQIH